MNRFRLIGTYELNSTKSDKKDTLVDVVIPLMDQNCILKYGAGSFLETMRKEEIYPTETGLDILMLGLLVFLADTRISRNSNSQDSWTREISIVLPVKDVDKWNLAKENINRMLRFLSGDFWNVTFIPRETDLCETNSERECTDKYNIASLFSGGMDSLISSINFLEEKKNVLLISFAGDAATKNAQNNILHEFDKLYPEIEHKRLDLWSAFPDNIIPDGGSENTTRSRSFLFISMAVCAMSGTKNINTLMIPENGLIALNVPLDMLRVGSHSTRTTHPFYLSMWNVVLNKLETGLSVKNIFWNKTKGEMAAECRNKKNLYNLMGLSNSCSSPTKGRWQGLPPQHCGYCYPCLIRRAAMYKAFGKDSTIYTKDKILELVNDRAESPGVQIRSVIYAADRIKKRPELANTYIHKSGPLDDNPDYLCELADTYKRGLLEVDKFIEDMIKKEKK